MAGNGYSRKPLPEWRTAPGERLALLFLASLRVIITLPAAALLLAGFVTLVCLCFMEEAFMDSLIRCLVILGGIETMLAMMLGAGWLEDQILVSRGHLVISKTLAARELSIHRVFLVLMEVAFLFCGAAVVIWIPAEYARDRNLTWMWPLFWGGFAAGLWWAMSAMNRRVDEAASVGRDHDLMPETPPSGAPGASTDPPA